MSYRVAAASSDGVTVDTHFGHALSFLIYDVDEEDGTYDLVEERAVFPACAGQQDCLQEEIRDDPMEQAAARLSDVTYLLVSRIGPHAIRALNRYGVTAFSIVLPIDEAIGKLNVYRERKKKILKRVDAEL